MLTNSEVDRRFSMLVADLNSAVQTVDWPGVSEPAEQFSPDEVNADGTHVDPTPDARLGALRVLALAVALVTVAAGIVVARAFDLGIVPIIVWFAIVVPGVTLGTLMLVDRLRRRS